MKTQKQLGNVHLKVEGLDIDRFKRLVDGHEVFQGLSIEVELDDGGDYIENFLYGSNAKWIKVHKPAIESGSRLITLNQLEELLGVERTVEVVKSEIDALQKELEELTRIKVGDVVKDNKGRIGVVEDIDKSAILYFIGGFWSHTAIKIDPNKTVKEVLGI